MGIKTFDQIKAAVEAIALKKQAAESNPPEDPNEVKTPETQMDGTISESCLNVPEGKENGKAVEEETNTLKLKESGDDPDVDADEKDTKVTEEKVAKDGASLLEKVKESIVTKQASPFSNIADGIFLNGDILAKIASEVLNTEEGYDFVMNLFRKKAGEDYANNLIKKATEQTKIKNKKEDTMNNLMKLASKLSKLSDADKKEFLRRTVVHNENLKSLKHGILKMAYAAGAEDAEAVIENPSLLNAPKDITVEEVVNNEQPITPDDIMEALSELVDAKKITPEEANAVIEKIMSFINGSANVDNNPEVDNPEAVNDVIAAAAAEGPTKLAHAIVKGTILLKKASAEQGLVEDENANIEDVISVIDQLHREGSITEDEAKAVIEKISDAIDEAKSEGREDEAHRKDELIDALEDSLEKDEEDKYDDSNEEDDDDEADDDDDDDKDDEDDDKALKSEISKIASVIKRA